MYSFRMDSGCTAVVETQHHQIQIIPMKELELEEGHHHHQNIHEGEGEAVVINLNVEANDVYCLFCFDPVGDYKQDRWYKKVLRSTCQRMFTYICNHLEIPVPEDHKRRKGVDKMAKEVRLHPGSLPLCQPCRSLYYKDLYETFVSYEAIMVKLGDQIADCITKNIAVSNNAHNNCQAVAVDGENTRYINEHGVMGAVRQFRNKVLEKNPMGYTSDAGENLNENVADESQTTDCGALETILPHSQTEEFRLDQHSAISTAYLESSGLNVALDEAIQGSSSKTSTYYSYTVSHPAPGVIQIIPLVINDAEFLDNGSSKMLRTNAVDQKTKKKKELAKREPPKKQTVHLRTCKFCKKTLPSQVALVDHEVKVHKREKPEKCDQCQFRCLSKLALRSHMETHLDDAVKSKPFACNICDAKFRVKRSLESHLRAHKGQKPYNCSMCSKSFACRESMKLCEAKHNGIKRFECSFCQKRFLRREVLQIHLRTHTGERPFVCQVASCQKAFAQRAPLKTHMKVHAHQSPSSALPSAKTKKKLD
ncbi:putative zinc finger protein [Orchesella cincta]|uniref:Putative zinc finger protein n=1 Tax=Orchesella cincta TaxID=48709 RepID=A0A1D2N3E1_ORCCI|nr:putative zinc finger protein [Orchesella cincta]